MKKLLLLVLCLLMMGCAGTKFYFFGVDLDWVKKADKISCVEMVVGVGTSVGAHVLGHYLAGELFDVDFEYKDFYTKEEITSYRSDSDVRWFLRGGFIFQHGIGLALTSFETTRQSYFTRGYVAAAALQTWCYPITADNTYNDFKSLDKFGGNGDIEYGIYSLVAAHNVLRVKW